MLKSQCTRAQVPVCHRNCFRIEQNGNQAVVTKQILLSAIVVIGLGLNNVGQLAAQNYPTRPIKLITPNSPGSPPDLIARLVAQRLSTTIGPAIVDNRPGA